MAPDLPFVYFAIATLFSIFSTMPFSNGITEREYYNICSSLYSCGKVRDIGYPFWGDNRPNFCGLPEFKLDCFGGYTHTWGTRNLGGDRIIHINTSTHSIQIARDKNEICGALGKPGETRHNKGSTTFGLGAGAVNITLFYGCNSTANRYNNASFTCPILDERIHMYHMDKGEEVSSNCTKKATFLVSKKAWDAFTNSNKGNGWTLEKVMETPFEMDYSFVNPADCLACQNSSGVCGSSVNPPVAQFVCYQDNRQLLPLILGLGIPVGVIIIVTVVVFCYRKKLKLGRSISRSLSHETTASDLGRGSQYFHVPLFSSKDLAEATNNFDQSGELGDGGFGRVYYGKLKDGRDVAVKQLYEKTYRRLEQFMNEVQILTRLRHQNLVSLYGCTSPNCKELLLVYEYICNGTVADHLYGEKANAGYLPWATRMRIAIETANALSYLHASDIIHRDVKTNNILLDHNFGVKVADFGLSRLFPNDVTHVSTAPQGTPGYLDPEYHQCYQLTVKSDVYSFGIVLIELITSLPAINMNREKHEINLSNYAINRIRRCAFEELVDPLLGFGSDFRVRRMTTSVAELAFRCLQHDKQLRPAMDEVLEVLKKIEITDYNQEFEAEDKEVTSHTKVVTPSPADQDDDAGVTLLMGSMDHHNDHQQMHLQSPNPVMDGWVSRSTAASRTSGQAGATLIYSMSN